MAKKDQTTATATTGTTPSEPKETKAERFVRLAVARVNKVAPFLGHIRNLANKQNYEYTPEQAAKIVAALRAEIDKIEAAFGGAEVPKEGFQL